MSMYNIDNFLRKTYNKFHSVKMQIRQKKLICRKTDQLSGKYIGNRRIKDACRR